MIDPSYFPDHEWRFGHDFRAYYISIDGAVDSITDSVSDSVSNSGDDSQTKSN